MQTCTIVGGKHIVPAMNGLDSSTYQLPDLGQITDLSTSENEVFELDAYDGSFQLCHSYYV